MGTQKLRRPPEAAEFLRDLIGIGSTKTLAKLRCVGGGPRFVRIGSRMIAYPEDGLREWAASRVSRPLASTSDRAEAA